MGPYASPDQPRPSPEVDTLRALAPADADVVHVRAAAPTAATGWAWSTAELCGAYQWPPHPGEPLVPLPRTADDSNHASLTICEFLRTSQYAGNVRQLAANDTTYTFAVRLTVPRWHD